MQKNIVSQNENYVCVCVCAVGSPAELGACVVLLADVPLMELPLEALSGLQDEGLSSVSRDLSLQLLHSRLHRKEQPGQTHHRCRGTGTGTSAGFDITFVDDSIPAFINDSKWLIITYRRVFGAHTS